MTIYTFGLAVPASPEYKGSWGHGGLFTNQLNQKSRKRHDSTLGHSPSGLYHNKILVSYVWWTMQPHVWRHVSHHIAKTVEASHSELKQKSTKDWEGTENGHICARNWRGECKSHSEKKKSRAILNDKRIILMCRIHPIICQFENFMMKQFTKLFMAYLESVFILTQGRANWNSKVGCSA